jgi:hypothetical protein
VFWTNRIDSFATPTWKTNRWHLFFTVAKMSVLPLLGAPGTIRRHVRTIPIPLFDWSNNLLVTHDLQKTVRKRLATKITLARSPKRSRKDPSRTTT